MESCPGSEHLQRTTARTRLREKLHRLPEAFQDDVESVLNMLNDADQSLVQVTRERDNVDRDYRELQDVLTARVSVAEEEVAALRQAFRAAVETATADVWTRVKSQLMSELGWSTIEAEEFLFDALRAARPEGT